VEGKYQHFDSFHLGNGDGADDIVVMEDRKIGTTIYTLTGEYHNIRKMDESHFDILSIIYQNSTTIYHCFEIEQRLIQNG
jgi:hypothetical protein